MRPKRYFDDFSELKEHLLKRVDEDLPVGPSSLTSEVIRLLAANGVTHKAQLYAFSDYGWQLAFARDHHRHDAKRFARALATMTAQEGVPLNAVSFASAQDIIMSSDVKSGMRDAQGVSIFSHYYIDWQARPFEEIIPLISQSHIHTDLISAPLPSQALTSLAKSLTGWLGNEPKKRLEFTGLTHEHMLSVLGPDVQDQIKQVLSTALRHKKARDITLENN